MSNHYTIIAISDIHMSNQLPYARPSENGRTDRLDDQLALWKHVARTAEVVRADALFMLGDVFDKARVDPVTLTHTVEAVMNLGLDTFVLAGNHDANTVRGGRFAVEAFGEMGAAHVHYMPTGGTIQPTEWLAFHPIAFSPLEATREALAEARGKALPHPAQNVLLLHHSILGCKHLGWTCDDGIEAAEVCDGFSTVLSGHFHEHQRFGPELQGMYLGAPMHHSFGDAGREQAGYWVIRFSRKNHEPKMRLVDPGLPRFHKVTDPEARPEVAPGDFLRYHIAATHREWSELKHKLGEVCEAYKAMGVRADFKQKPVPVKSVRLKGATSSPGAAATFVLDDQISAYVDHVAPHDDEVKSELLKHEPLKRLGRELLAEARRAT
jgi:DNA repair exonuclease SbcCD nuclease subunit